ncbi:MAG: hypothetical protein ACI3VU_09405 [Faecousia sp.]|nr:hypothetical protein [Bacillota bacterium]
MRRLIFGILLALFLSANAFATESVGIDTDALDDGLSEEAEEIMPEISPSVQGDLWESIKAVFFKAFGKTGESLKSGLRLCAMLLGITTLCAIVELSSVGKYAGVITAAGALGICAAIVGTVQTMVSLAVGTVQDIAAYSACLMPVMASAAAMSGCLNASTALYAGTTLFVELLLQLISKLLIPAVFLYLAIAAAEAALASDMLSELREFIGWVISKSLRILLYLFLAYMSATSVISGAADAAAIKATKAAVSSMIPVVGGIISDASETLLASASILKSSVGVFGMVAVVATCLVPFLRVGIQYLLLKITAAISGTVGLPSHIKLLKHCATAMGYLLAMCGTSGLLLLISSVCFMKVVA